eukprot:scaffold18473_cov16-Tisochrysis_lutea.AAC.4
MSFCCALSPPPHKPTVTNVLVEATAKQPGQSHQVSGPLTTRAGGMVFEQPGIRTRRLQIGISVRGSNFSIGVLSSPDQVVIILVKAESVLDEAALRQLYYLLEEFAVADGDALKINYDGFSQ